MNWMYYSSGLISGLGIGIASCAWLNLRRARRIAAAIREMGKH